MYLYGKNYIIRLKYKVQALLALISSFQLTHTGKLDKVI